MTQVSNYVLAQLTDFTGMRFGRLTAVKCVDIDTPKHKRWLFACDCGGERIAVASQMKYNHTKLGVECSCGCVAKRTTKTHGHSVGLKTTKEYRTWLSMKRRCSKDSQPNYVLYGGRGIKVCDEWKYDFDKFLSDMGNCPDGYSLERIDCNGNYSKENCCWIPLSEQASNTRRNIYFDYLGYTLTQEDVIKSLGVSFYRLKNMVVKNTLPLGFTYLGKLNALEKETA
jgi:hypothetical protein